MTTTRSIDFSTLTLRDALDLAILVEEEARDRYEEFAYQMALHHNDESARFFRFMFQVESSHEHRLLERRRKLFGSERGMVTREMIFDIEAPEYDDVRATMSERQALETALHAEEKAFLFFDKALPRVHDADVKALFTELRDEEAEHQAKVKEHLGRLGPDSPIDPEDLGDEPVAH